MQCDNQLDQLKYIETKLESIVFMLNTLKTLKVDNQLKTVQMVRSGEDYYQRSLSERQKILRAPSTYHLCKTIVMRNSLYSEQYKDDPFYLQYVVVMVQYERKLKTQNILAVVKDYQRVHYKNDKEKWIGRKDYKFRLADDDEAFQLTGYQYNGIMPFLMKNENLVVILAEDIYKLVPKIFWMGGGRPELKLGIGIEEFMQYFGHRVIIGDIS